jgi:hypothetical protein
MTTYRCKVCKFEEYVDDGEDVVVDYTCDYCLGIIDDEDLE